LARVMDKCIDGFQNRAPFPFRLLGKFVFKKKILRKGMTPGFRLPAKSEEELVSPPVDTAAGLEHLRRALARLQTENKRVAHPFFGKMTLAEWERLHLRHAELHMSFISS